MTEGLISPNEMAAEQARRAEFEKAIRHECSKIASAEYQYWKNLPDPVDPILRGMQLSAMGAAANICAAIALGRSAKEHSKGMAGKDAASRLLPDLSEVSL